MPGPNAKNRQWSPPSAPVEEPAAPAEAPKPSYDDLLLQVELEREEKEAALKQISDVQQSCSELEAQVKRLESEAVELSKRLATCQEEAESLRAENDGMREQVRRQSVELHELRQQLASEAQADTQPSAAKFVAVYQIHTGGEPAVVLPGEPFVPGSDAERDRLLKQGVIRRV